MSDFWVTNVNCTNEKHDLKKVYYLFRQRTIKWVELRQRHQTQQHVIYARMPKKYERYTNPNISYRVRSNQWTQHCIKHRRNKKVIKLLHKHVH